MVEAGRGRRLALAVPGRNAAVPVLGDGTRHPDCYLHHLNGAVIAPGSPWQNGSAERLIGTLRCECLDQMLIFGEAHLRRILSAYAAYYNQARTHLALQKDVPLHRAVQPSGAIVAIPILVGLHHQYVRM
jgi:transposase InsO family protein